MSQLVQNIIPHFVNIYAEEGVVYEQLSF